jgi:transposase
MEGSTATVRIIPNRTSSFPKLGAGESVGASAPGRGARSQRPWRTGFERSICGREFCSRQKRGLCVGKTKRGKGTKIMAVADRNGLPVAVSTDSASPAEVKLVTQTLEQRFVTEVPERLIGDKAYDSDALDKQVLEQFGSEMIAPHREGRRSDRITQDGRPLRRFQRRWKIERLFAWLFNFRRLVVRYEYHAENYFGFIQLACLIILLRHL